MISNFWSTLGSTTVSLNAEDHDAIVARTSHLPHFVASALVNAVIVNPRVNESGFLGAGFCDTTRLASGSPPMWRDIALTNAKAISQAIDDLQAELRQVKKALKTKDALALESFFAEGKSARDQWIKEWSDK